MAVGYSRNLVDANRKASAVSCGVRLGRLCIRADIPVSKIAGALGVSRATVYNWFTGETIPAPEFEIRILEWMDAQDAPAKARA